jgi:hypothetical protein
MQSRAGVGAAELHRKAKVAQGYAAPVAGAGLSASRSIARTLTLGSWSPESAKAWMHNVAGEAAEDFLHRRIMKSADRLSQNAAMLVGIGQKHMTERAISKADRMRAHAADIVGAPTKDELEHEKAIVAEMQKLVRRQIQDLDKQRALRTKQNKSVDRAASAAVIRMQAQKKFFDVAMGHIDPGILKDLQKEFPRAFDRGEASIIQLQREAQRKANVGPI